MKANSSENDQVAYLNRGESPAFVSKLRLAIEAAKISRMPRDQWASFIKGLGAKGVKKDDIQDSGVLRWLEGEEFDSPSPGKPVEKASVLEAIDRYSVTVKEVVLGRPQYKNWHHGGPDTPYMEILFIANSEHDNVQDRIEEIEFQMESLSFDMSRLVDDPDFVLRLEKERGELMRKAPDAAGFRWPHFRSNNIEGRHGKNLLAHARVTIHDGLFFIEEIQSDWGQHGRVKREENERRRANGLPEINWHDHVPKAPFVTDTKLWAGLVLRRLLQRAARMPEIDRVAWIRLDMRNGGRVNPRITDARKRISHEETVLLAQARGEPAPIQQQDDSDHFYTRVIPSLAEAAMGKAGGKVGMVSEVIDDFVYQDIPGFKMTEEVREVLKGVQPLYSAASVLRNPVPTSDEKLVELVRRARDMIGGAAHIRFVDRLYNLDTLTMVSGKVMGRFIDVALNSADLELTMDHECYHFAHENLLSAAQRRVMSEVFAQGTSLNARVRSLLERDSFHAAAAQCDSAEEAAAHGFSYWRRGELEMSDAEPMGVFQSIRRAIMDCVGWLSSILRDQPIATPEGVFEALRSGEFLGASDPVFYSNERPAFKVERLRA